ncbi:MAG: hypothetical protein KAT16_01885 [Candidatus Heimdallarchaeota archaeon]|nr:hypothetical protein [Candidatus Heimdallarchaeota archaeon]
MGQMALCYTQDTRPLLLTTSAPDEFFCPLLKVTISTETYSEIEEVLAPLLMIQDEQNTAINLWPMLSGWSNPKHQATSNKGQELIQMSVHLRETLENIVVELT